MLSEHRPNTYGSGLHSHDMIVFSGSISVSTRACHTQIGRSAARGKAGFDSQPESCGF